MWWLSVDGELLVAGVITETGSVLCNCDKCHGAPVTFSEFEIHAGSNNRRPGECIILSECGASLKVLSSDLCPFPPPFLPSVMLGIASEFGMASNCKGRSALHAHCHPLTCYI